MDTALTRLPTDAGTPLCPSCGRPMRFKRAIPRLGALPELRTYECAGCAVTYTEAVEPDAAAAAGTDRTNVSRAH